MPDETYPRHLGRLIGNMRTLLEQTNSSERELLETFEQSTSGSTSTREEALAELEERITTSRASLDIEHRNTMQSLEDEEGQRLEHAEKQYNERKVEIENEAKKMRQDARKGLQEEEWLAESVYEATGTEPRKRLQLTCNELEVIERRLDEQRHQVDIFRRRCRIQAATAMNPVEIEPSSADPEVALQSLREYLDSIDEAIKKLLGQYLARLFIGPVPFILVILGSIAAWACGLTAWQLTHDEELVQHAIWSIWAGLGGLILTAIALVCLRKISTSRFGERESHINEMFQAAETMMTEIRRVAGEQCDMQESDIRDRRDHEIKEARDSFAPKIEQVAPRRERRRSKLEQNYDDLNQKIVARSAEKREEEKQRYLEEGARLDAELEDGRKASEENWNRTSSSAKEHRDSVLNKLEADWKNGTSLFKEEVERIARLHSECNAPAWSSTSWSKWTPPGEFNGLVPYGTYDVAIDALAGGLPRDPRLAWPMENHLVLPAMVDLPRSGSLFLDFGEHGRDEAISTLQNLMLRLLVSLPPGKVRFTVIDPVGLGQSFAGFMHLADHDEIAIIDKIWTEPRHIDQQLNDLTEHMENVIQTYLRNEYETIDEYNDAAGEIAEPYRFLVMADLPVNLSENAGSRLTSIAQTGARCGVYTLLACDNRQTFPRDVHREDLVENSTVLHFQNGAYRSADESLANLPLTLDAPPEEERLTELVQAAGLAAERSHRVEVPFSVITPKPKERWTGSTAKELRVALGQSGATRQQQLVLGRGTSQHALVAGKTGSGKSTLLHVLITNLALWYSPEEIAFYLVDFKKGVEFKTYAESELPHARVIAIESDREFGLSVLQRIDEELRSRGELFRDEGVQDIGAYRSQTGESIPRLLLVIDEFQELFVDDDKLSQDASMLLDRIVRQGRAFGIHALLGSQTLDGAYSLARSTLGQMGVRIALQCTEADSYLILSEENAAARLLGRPGEAIYNDAGGKVEGNSPFQVCWLDDDSQKKSLDEIRKLAEKHGTSVNGERFIFEGNIPAELPACRLLDEQLDSKTPATTPASLQGWLGDAIAIKDPTAFQLQLHSGSNLLIVGQREETVTAILLSIMLALGAQARPASSPGKNGIMFHVLDALPGDSPSHGVLGSIGEAMPHEVTAGTHRDTANVLEHLGGILQQRREAGEASGARIVLIAHGLHRLRDLRRPEDDFSFSSGDPDQPASPDAIFAELLKDGPAHGIHVITWVDTLNNLSRTLDRNSQREFEMRVLFQMGANDSSHLIDDPAASGLGLQRALFASEDTGIIEKFRPWAIPEQEWIDSAIKRLRG